jgi:hypothetical protein
LGSGRRAINADKNGPSIDIINHVEASGSQKKNICFGFKKKLFPKNEKLEYYINYSARILLQK